jgi:hypothetical protein
MKMPNKRLDVERNLKNSSIPHPNLKKNKNGTNTHIELGQDKITNNRDTKM